MTKKTKSEFMNKKLWKQFGQIISIPCGVLSVMTVFIDIPLDARIPCGIAWLCMLIAIFIILLIRAEKMECRVLKINNTEIIVKFGDLFQEDGLKTISFNEYFDSKVDDVLISSKSINGKFLQRQDVDVTEVDKTILDDIHCRENIIAKNEAKKMGKQNRYRLGTCVKYNDYILTAFAKFDDKNRAYLNMDEFFIFLLNYWCEVNRLYNNQNIILPLLGTGITRLNNGNSISYQNILEILLSTFAYSHMSFSHTCKIILVISEELKSEINLYDLKSAWE